LTRLTFAVQVQFGKFGEKFKTELRNRRRQKLINEKAEETRKSLASI